ncbi:MAG: TIGR04283 family arsenosugar biosynthesis glycosyltransferase, partial [Thermoanaerobaculia bacterium]
MNEEENLQRALDMALAHADEVIVSDGGSTDSTLSIAHSSTASVVSSEPGRGPQLNRGGASANSDILLFLHADTTLPEGGLDQVRAAIGDGAVGGGFSVQFDAATFWFRVGSRIVNFRTRLTGIPLGDQGQFVTAQVFASMGGYQPWPILEDLDFARRLKQQGRLKILDSAVTTSARRYLARGTIRTIATNWMIWTLFLVGVSPHRLA